MLIDRRLLDGVHHPGLDGIDVRSEVRDEVLLGDPGKPLLVDDQMRQRRRRRTAAQQRSERFALVKAESGDVDERDDIRRVGAERGHDLAAVGVAGDDRRATLAVEDLPQPGDIVGQ